uniref:Uncharacterized protein n=1 Tax=Rhizophora mucronata TaxID=61149 RepID=A0A2P2MTV9_RHIMU
MAVHYKNHMNAVKISPCYVIGSKGILINNDKHSEIMRHLNPLRSLFMPASII